MHPRVVHAEAITDLRVAVTFANGERGVLDMRPYLVLPVFQILADPGQFRRAHADHGTVAWSEDLDLCPDSVWADAVRVGGDPPAP